MFNPTTETGKGWDGDIRDDVILEVSFRLFYNRNFLLVHYPLILDG